MFHCALSADPGIVHQDVQFAKAAHSHGHRLLPVGFPCHIQTHKQCFAACRFDVCLNLTACRFQKVPNNNPGALLSE
jgi:hypothetical protein